MRRVLRIAWDWGILGSEVRMANIALRAYDHEIESMIEQGQRLDEAVAHCRHILATYPKHLDTYRLLGKAYLEAKRHDQAVDIFQRVLVAAPEDFVSHVGMSIIADDQGRLDEAIWHMERAFEVQPSNAAIQAELQRLFGRRDGVEPPKIRLTRGALAHMYVQGELYTQAISEIRAVIANDSQRMDMQVLLARAYFRSGQKAEAADVCSALLAVSPFCMDANRLMAEILPGTQAAEAAQEYRRRVLELDPYAEFAKGSIFATDSVADAAVTLQRLEYTGEALGAGTGITMGLSSGVRNAEAAPAAPSWLSPNADPDAHAKSPVEQDQDLPEFLRGSGWREVPADSAVSGGFESVDRTEAESQSEVEAGDLPEWVRALAPNDDQEPLPDSMGQDRPGNDWHLTGNVSPESRTRADAGAVEDTPDWLRDLARGPEPVVNTPSSPQEQAPGAQQSQEREAAGVATPENDQALAWLEGLAEKHGAKPEELITPPETRTENPPDWIERLRQDEAAVPKRREPTSEAPRESGSINARTSDEPADAKVHSSTDWLNGLADSDAFAEMEKSAATDPTPLAMGASAWTQPVSPADASLPDWLSDKPSEPAPASPVIAREPSSGNGSGAELPDWLSDLDGTKKSLTVEAAPGDEELRTPDWLRPTAVQSVAEADDSQWRPVNAEALPAETSASPIARPAALPAGAGAPVSARTRPVPQGSLAEAQSLGAAKAELGRGNIAAALDIYGRLIRKGKALPEIIRELRDALYRYPVEVPIWQSLGDAYMRANRLQEALDAYTKAEELLR
jgi:tetratricopeptide (TPR) repeat protein